MRMGLSFRFLSLSLFLFLFTSCVIFGGRYTCVNDHLIDKLNFHEMSKSQFILLGESSHGTSEYYSYRSAITKKLIENHGISFVAVEGDWPYIYQANRYVLLLDDEFKNGKDALLRNNRWPEWMWANKEFLEFVEWLRAYNFKQNEINRVGIYGMDMQNPTQAVAAVFEFINNNNIIDQRIGIKIEKFYRCFDPYQYDFISYARGTSSCNNDAESALNVFKENHLDSEIYQKIDLLNLKVNLLNVQFAEKYFRKMRDSSQNTWNIRVEFMKRVLLNLMSFTNKGKGVVWAHNTHVGDARATSMSQNNMVNIGQLLREVFDVYIVGFGTYKGKVMAARSWGATPQVFKLPIPPKNSLEHYLFLQGSDYLVLNRDDLSSDKNFIEFRGHRAKGVVYNPEKEQYGNYVPTILSERYDSFIFFKTTSAVNPI